MTPLASATMKTLKRPHAKPIPMCATTSTCDCELYVDRKHRDSDDNLF
jgi:hypothetical protein